MADGKGSPEDPFKQLENDLFKFELPERRLFSESHREYQVPAVYTSDDRWGRTSQFIFEDCTSILKSLTDKTYSLTVKCKTLPSIPEFIRRDRRAARVTQLFLAVNRIKEIPDGMGALVQLRNCSLDRNKLRSLKSEFGLLTSIENLDIGNNQFKMVPKEIFMLKSLRVLRLSVNEIEELPTGFAQLKQLENLRIGSNRLERLPEDFGECHSLKYLKLASNRFREFPNEILKLPNLEQLMISTNKIQVIPMELFDNRKLQMFHAEGNPLQQPPLAVVSKGLGNIREYWQAYKKGDIRDDRLRVLFLGATGAGKTTLCHALVRGPTADDPERTVGIEQHQYELRDVKMTLWDFAGQELYYNTHHVFITSGALVILVVNLEEYNRDNCNNNGKNVTSSYDTLVGMWIDHIAMQVPNAVILVVGTHMDKVDDSKQRIEDILEKIQKHRDTQRDNMKIRITHLEERIGILDKDTEEGDHQLILIQKQIDNLTRMAEQDLQIQFKSPVLVCSKEPHTEGLQKFKDTVVSLALNETLFKDRGQNRPSSWKATERVIVEERKPTAGSEESKTGMWNIQDLVARVMEKVPAMETPEQVYPVLKYLHSLGEVVWFDEVEDVKECVFINPAVLIDVFKMVINDKLDRTLDEKNWREIKLCGITKIQLKLDRQKYKDVGLISHKLLYMLWRKLPAKEKEVAFLVKVLEQFDLCYTAGDIGVHSLNADAPVFSPSVHTTVPTSEDITRSPSAGDFTDLAVADEMPISPVSDVTQPLFQMDSPEGQYQSSHPYSQVLYPYPGQAYPAPFHHHGMSPPAVYSTSPGPHDQFYYPNYQAHPQYMFASVPVVPTNGFPSPQQYTNPVLLQQQYPSQQLPIYQEPQHHHHQQQQQHLQQQHLQQQQQQQQQQSMGGILNPMQSPPREVFVGSPQMQSTPSVPRSQPRVLTLSDARSADESDGSAASSHAQHEKRLSPRRPRREKTKLYSLFPCYLPDSSQAQPEENPPSSGDDHHRIRNKVELFPVIPCGFFERFQVCCHKEELKFAVTHIWKHGIRLTAQGVNARIRREDNEMLIMETRSEKTSVSLGNMWSVILKINGLINKLLQRWPGVRSDIYTVCPVCLEKGIEDPFLFILNLPFEKEAIIQYSKYPEQCTGSGHCGQMIDYELVHPISQVENEKRGAIQINNYYFINNCENIQTGNDSSMSIGTPEKSV